MTERIPDDPKYKTAAANIAASFATEQAALSLQGKPHNKGNHQAISWCIQEDGSLTVVLESGPKINRELGVVAKLTAKLAGQIDTTDGTDSDEASLAGKALQSRRTQQKK